MSDTVVSGVVFDKVEFDKCATDRCRQNIDIHRHFALTTCAQDKLRSQENQGQDNPGTERTEVMFGRLLVTFLLFTALVLTACGGGDGTTAPIEEPPLEEPAVPAE